jgi:hypothetical protein
MLSCRLLGDVMGKQKWMLNEAAPAGSRILVGHSAAWLFMRELFGWIIQNCSCERLTGEMRCLDGNLELGKSMASGGGGHLAMKAITSYYTFSNV